MFMQWHIDRNEDNDNIGKQTYILLFHLICLGYLKIHGHRFETCCHACQ